MGSRPALTYLFGEVGARIFTVLMLVVGRGVGHRDLDLGCRCGGLGTAFAALFRRRQRCSAHGGSHARLWQTQRETRLIGRRGGPDRCDERLPGGR